MSSDLLHPQSGEESSSQHLQYGPDVVDGECRNPRQGSSDYRGHQTTGLLVMESQPATPLDGRSEQGSAGAKCSSADAKRGSTSVFSRPQYSYVKNYIKNAWSLRGL